MSDESGVEVDGLSKNNKINTLQFEKVEDLMGRKLKDAARRVEEKRIAELRERQEQDRIKREIADLGETTKKIDMEAIERLRGVSNEDLRVIAEDEISRIETFMAQEEPPAGAFGSALRNVAYLNELVHAPGVFVFLERTGMRIPIGETAAVKRSLLYVDAKGVHVHKIEPEINSVLLVKWKTDVNPRHQKLIGAFSSMAPSEIFSPVRNAISQNPK